MKPSEEAHRAFLRAVEHGDGGMVTDLIQENSSIEARYISWTEFERDPQDDPEEHGLDLGAILMAGAEIDEQARSSGRTAFVLPCDGPGCHYFIADSEVQLVKAIEAAAAVLSEEASEGASVKGVRDGAPAGES